VINGRGGRRSDPKSSVVDARNRKEHLSLVRMLRLMRRMPPPNQPSRAELIADLQQDIEGPE
jgi:hypothetical protein